MRKFDTIEYLINGNKKQKLVYKLLSDYAIIDDLKEFNPILVGTIPIGIDTHDSDIDICCCWKCKKHFIERLKIFSRFSNFTIVEKIVRNRETVIVRFTLRDFKFEIFGQNRSAKEQEAYKHMIIEHILLQEKGEEFKDRVIELKLKGLKTEPAFAQILGIKGDPYQGLLRYSIE